MPSCRLISRPIAKPSPDKKGEKQAVVTQSNKAKPQFGAIIVPYSMKKAHGTQDADEYGGGWRLCDPAGGKRLSPKRPR